MSVQVEPYQLRFLGSRFSSGAEEIRLKASRMESIMMELVQSSWKGTGAHAFTMKCEAIKGQLQKTAEVLDHAMNTLNRFAYQMEHVNQMRQQANMLEQQSWSYSGDSIDDLHHRQNIARQAAQLRQEAEWEAYAADAQAANEFHSMMSMVPQLLDQLNELTGAQTDHNQLLEAFRRYYFAKQPDYLPEADREEAVEQDMQYLSELTNEQLYNRLEDLISKDEKAQYYVKLVQQPNFDAKQAWNTDLGYQEFVKGQLAQNESPGGLMEAGMGFAAGIMKALGPKYGRGAASDSENTYNRQSDEQEDVGSDSNQFTGETSGETKGVELSDFTKEVMETKPMNSPIPEKWYKKGGSISIDENGTWTYTNKKGQSVRYPNGYPDFIPYAHPTVQSVKIEIAVPTNRSTDYKSANLAAQLSKDSDPSVPSLDRPPEGYTWHHHEDGTTMILVDKDIHREFTHTGGISKNNDK